MWGLLPYCTRPALNRQGVQSSGLAPRVHPALAERVLYFGRQRQINPCPHCPASDRAPPPTFPECRKCRRQFPCGCVLPVPCEWDFPPVYLDVSLFAVRRSAFPRLSTRRRPGLATTL